MSVLVSVSWHCQLELFAKFLQSFLRSCCRVLTGFLTTQANMTPTPTTLSVSDFILCVVFLTYGLFVHTFTSLSLWVHCTCQHVWFNLAEKAVHTFRVAATASERVYDLAASVCRSKWHVFSSTCNSVISTTFSPFVKAATVFRTAVESRVSRPVTTVGTSAWHLCYTRSVTLCQHLVFTVLKAPFKLANTLLGACACSILAVAQMACSIVPDNLVCSTAALLKVVKFFWHKYQVFEIPLPLNQVGLILGVAAHLLCLLLQLCAHKVWVLKAGCGNDAEAPSDDLGPDSSLRSGKAINLVDIPAPAKRAPTYNITSSCGAHQIVETLVVKVAQVCSHRLTAASITTSRMPCIWCNHTIAWLCTAARRCCEGWSC